jgi:hypothetical protein
MAPASGNSDPVGAIDLRDVEGGVGFQERDFPIEFLAGAPISVFVNRLAKTTMVPVSPLRTAPPSWMDCLNVIQIGNV